MDTDLAIHRADCPSLGRKSFPFAPTRMKSNMYQLVYNELEEEDDNYDEEEREGEREKEADSRDSEREQRFGDIDFLRAMNVQGDGNSTDLHLSRSEMFTRILGRSEIDGWSSTYGSYEEEKVEESELRISTSRDMEDTFETELKEARLLHLQLGTVSPIGNGCTENQNRFDDNADFSKICSPPFFHSTPIKSSCPPPELPSLCDSRWKDGDTPIAADPESFSGLIRFFGVPSTNDRANRSTSVRQLFGRPPSAVVPSLHRGSFLSRMRNSVRRSFPRSDTVRGGKRETVAVGFEGPTRFEVDPGDCFFDDDVAHLCMNVQGPSADFGENLRVGTGGEECGERFAGGGILSNRVQSNTDDDYEDALCQNPSDPWTKGNADVEGGGGGGEDGQPEESFPPGRSKLAGRILGWAERCRIQMLVMMTIFLVVILALLVVAVALLGRNGDSRSSSSSSSSSSPFPPSTASFGGGEWGGGYHPLNATRSDNRTTVNK